MNKRKTYTKRYKINHNIRYPEVRVVDDGKGNNIGIVSSKEAQKLADALGVDLVVITEGAKPPICKILDFNKYLYEQNKKSAQIKSKAKNSKLKEVKLGATSADDSIEIKAKRVKEFLADGNRVKITVLLRGRQQAYPELGAEKIDKLIKLVGDDAKLEGEIKLQGRTINATLLKK